MRRMQESKDFFFKIYLQERERETDSMYPRAREAKGEREDAKQTLCWLWSLTGDLIPRLQDQELDVQPMSHPGAPKVIGRSEVKGRFAVLTLELNLSEASVYS